jgi:stage II sporulation protein AA (anti-sigma F factor antagonist)
VEFSQRNDHRDELVFTVEGELDLDTAPAFRERLLAGVDRERVRVAVIDLAGCTFIDSSGLAVIIEAGHRLDQRLQSLRIRNLDGQPKELFEITMVGEAPFIDVEPSAA